MPVTDKPNVLEGLSFVIPNGGKGALCSHISQHMVKSQSELEKSHSWRFEPQRSETFSRVADLRIPKVKSFLMNNSFFPPCCFLHCLTDFMPIVASTLKVRTCFSVVNMSIIFQLGLFHFKKCLFLSCCMLFSSHLA